MGADFASDAVFERSDDLSACRVVFRIGGEDEQDIQWQTDRIALNLDVAFLHDIEKPDLDFPGQIRQFVYGENSAVGARQQTIVHGQLVREISASPCRLDGIYVADNIGDGHVGRCEFFHKAILPFEPGDRSAFALFGYHFAASSADGP